MNKTARHIICLPFSLLYGMVTAFRNLLFDRKVLHTATFNRAIISIGNLAVGGTGKTPHTEFIIKKTGTIYPTAVLSRGYKRKTRGFVLAQKGTNSDLIGDEPYQIFSKFGHITVAVDEKRARGVARLLEIDNTIQVILLDDAFQHRYIKAGLSILLSDYSNLYSRDHMLPGGTLREYRSGSKRAHLIVVTKCPDKLTSEEAENIRKELRPLPGQSIFFSGYGYENLIAVFDNTPIEWSSNLAVLIVAGIVKPQELLTYIRQFTPKVNTMFYPDHHPFSKQDFDDMGKQLRELGKGIIVMTEKDAARIRNNPEYPDELKAVTYALPISVKILFNQEQLFINKIQDYVIKNTRNS